MRASANPGYHRMDRKVLSEDDYEDLEAKLLGLQRCDLSDWDENFVEETLARFEKFGTGTFLSPNQREQIDRMVTRYL